MILFFPWFAFFIECFGACLLPTRNNYQSKKRMHGGQSPQNIGIRQGKHPIALGSMRLFDQEGWGRSNEFRSCHDLRPWFALPGHFYYEGSPK